VAMSAPDSAELVLDAELLLSLRDRMEFVSVLELEDL